MTLSVEEFRYVGISIGIVVSFTGVVGNLLTILAYFTNKRMQTSFNLIIVNLAFVDLMISALILPFIVCGYWRMEWPFSPTSCEAFAYFYYASHYTSASFLVAISLNRYLHVQHPYNAHTFIFSGRNRWFIGVLLWLFAPVMLLPLLFTGGFGWWDDGFLCAYTRNSGFTEVYSLFVRIVFQMLPLICMMVLYFSIFQIVKKSHSSVDNPRIRVKECENVWSTNDFTNHRTTYPTRSYQRSGIDASKSLERSRDKSKVLELEDIIKPSIEVASNIAGLYCNIFPENQQQSHRRRSNTTDGRSYQIALSRKKSMSTYFNVSQNNPEVNLPCAETDLPKPAEVSQIIQSPRVVTFSEQNKIQTRKVASHHFLSSQNVELSRTNLNLQSRHPSIPSFHQMTERDKHVTGFSGQFATFERKRAFSVSAIHFNATINRSRRKLRRSLQHAKAQRQLIYMCSVVCITYGASALPSLFLNLIGNYNNVSPIVHMAMSNLGWFTSMINPIVYAVMNSQFRTEYISLIKKSSTVFVCLTRKRSQRIRPAPLQSNSIATVKEK